MRFWPPLTDLCKALRTTQPRRWAASDNWAPSSRPLRSGSPASCGTRLLAETTNTDGSLGRLAGWPAPHHAGLQVGGCDTGAETADRSSSGQDCDTACCSTLAQGYAENCRGKEHAPGDRCKTAPSCRWRVGGKPQGSVALRAPPGSRSYGRRQVPGFGSHGVVDCDNDTVVDYYRGSELINKSHYAHICLACGPTLNAPLTLDRLCPNNKAPITRSDRTSLRGTGASQAPG